MGQAGLLSLYRQVPLSRVLALARYQNPLHPVNLSTALP
jgi:hypothetical protein